MLTAKPGLVTERNVFEKMRYDVITHNRKEKNGYIRRVPFIIKEGIGFNLFLTSVLKTISLTKGSAVVFLGKKALVQ